MITPARSARAACRAPAWLLAATALALPFTLGCPPDRAPESADDRAFREGSTDATTLEHALAVAEELAAGETPLAPAADAAANAATIDANAALALGACGTVSRSGATVTIDFGTGCTLPSGIVARGTLALSVTVAAGTVTLDADFDAVTLDASSVDGVLSLATTNGTSYASAFDLTFASGTVSGELTLDASAVSITLSGSFTSVPAGGAPQAIAIAGLVWRRGDCYPSAGTVTLGTGPLAQVVAFSSATAATGAVVVTLGRATRTLYLPAYGACPSS